MITQHDAVASPASHTASTTLGQSVVRDMSYPAPSAFSHASIFSGANFAAVVRFYQIVLNMRVKYVIKNKFHLVLLGCDGEDHRLSVMELSKLEARPVNSVRIEHTSWRYRSLEELLEVVRYVERELGVFPTADHRGCLIGFHYTDPDDNRCEMFVDLLPTQEEITQFFVDKMAADPDYITLLPFDLRGMLAKQSAGESIENLKSYEWVRDNLPVGKSGHPL